MKDINSLDDAGAYDGTENIEIQKAAGGPGSSKRRSLSSIVAASQPNRTVVSVSAGTMTLDLGLAQEKKFEATTAISSNFTLAFSNDTNIEEFLLKLPITGTVVVTVPSTVVSARADNRFNNTGTKTITLAAVGTGDIFELSFERWDGPIYVVRFSGANFPS